MDACQFDAKFLWRPPGLHGAQFASVGIHPSSFGPHHGFPLWLHSAATALPRSEILPGRSK